MRWLQTVVICLLLGTAWGCPREVQAPEPGASAQPCSSLSECNEARCGELRACVDGLCEEDASLIVPCVE